MKSDGKLVKEVNDFLSKCSDAIGNFEQDMFEVNTYFACLEYGADDTMKSPLEHLLYIALKTLQRLNAIDDLDTGNGLSIIPQIKIGKYRVDFGVFYKKDKELKSVIVECDSQQWHERTEKERRYEKARDRLLIKEGYEVFHYTGKEIKDNALNIAKEIIEHVSGLEDLQIDLNSEDDNE